MPCTLQPPQKRPRTDAYSPNPMDVFQQIEFSVASPRTVSLHSAQADAILQTINLEYMSDADFDSERKQRIRVTLTRHVQSLGPPVLTALALMLVPLTYPHFSGLTIILFHPKCIFSAL